MLSTSELFILSTALGADLFSVAIPLGVKRTCRRIIIRAAVIFAAFHLVMILAGVYLGSSFGIMLEKLEAFQLFGRSLAAMDLAKVTGAAVLILLGIHMIKENIYGEKNKDSNTTLLQGKALWLLAFSVSIDALAAGFSLGMMEVDLVKLCVILGLVIFLIAIIGLGLGRKIGGIIGSRAELAGGLMLILLGGHFIWITTI